MSNPELAGIEIHGVTRQSFLVKGTLAAGALYGLSTVAPFVSEAIARESDGDVGILNFALALEHIESAFYGQALEDVRALEGEALELTRTIRQNEADHVDALAEAIKSLGGTPVEAPRTDFGDAFASPTAYLRTAQTLEDLGVSAYNGAAPSIKNREVLGSALSVVQVEARHAAAVRELNDRPITDGPFDKAAPMDQVRRAVEPYVKS